MTTADEPVIGLAVTTVGRPRLAELLRSAARGRRLPAVVAVANQAGRPLDLPLSELPFEVRVVASEGGASRGRNDAVAALGQGIDVLGFPNDDSALEVDTLALVVSVWSDAAPPAAVAGSLHEGGTPRYVLPDAGTALDRRTVWLAIEPSMFISLDAFRAVGGFRADIGTGSPSPWQSGEGTDLLLRVLERGDQVVSRPDVRVLGPGERRALPPRQFVSKHRGYARGTGFVHRVHDYPAWLRLRLVLAPLVVAARHDDDLRLSLRLALARSLGRLEGLAGRTVGRSDVRWERT